MYLPHRTVALHACEQIQMISAALWFCTTTVWFTQDQIMIHHHIHWLANVIIII